MARSKRGNNLISGIFMIILGVLFIFSFYKGQQNNLKNAATHPISVTATVTSSEGRTVRYKSKGKTKTKQVNDITVSFETETGEKKQASFNGVSPVYGVGSDFEICCTEDWSDPIPASSTKQITGFNAILIYGICGVTILIGFCMIGMHIYHSR